MLMMSTWSSATLVGSAALAAVVVAFARPPQGGAPGGQQIAGISCDAMEGSRIHIHQHLLILDHGNAVPIPNNVGRPLTSQCLYWIHTHTPDGIIHIESPNTRTFTLGDFFTIWGQPLTSTRAATATAAKGAKLKVWVDGKPYTDDPRKIPLAAHTDIVVEAGPPFPAPPKFTAWNGA
jgi:hypothetical protein